RSKGNFELRIEPRRAEVGTLEQNSVYRAWRLLCGLSGAGFPVRIRLQKKIPAEAGLGGGSADAAAVLVGLNELFEIGLDVEDLRSVGAKIGADVPFALTGGTALTEGVGEILTPLPAPPVHHLLVAKPERGANTGGIYRAYDEHPGKGTTSIKPVVAALRAGDLPALAQAIGNDLERVTTGFVPEVKTHRKDLLRLGAMGAAMSGTGTAVFGVFGSEAEARAAVDGLQAPFVAICEPVSHGVRRL
ncbi:MAG TPA: 4-(cytidine 5'-diphospho)-2-C-methyl-D-erythritol kinase, partial [Rubrobacteraceae bacterium]|nr:4-(cytidine 5'-diphospho)-2-C-methyl-D-erythritol kinase [Rubrobacteraceae bacterium]